ncbi:calmodulin-dependent protein kinase II-delta dash [Reticulomyxa filosa]|uniref:Calmodulin-dependent protein kinase II-delta dash n=1 Tax=Reticulomyxa filosa TaxID=46433 RepID=X6NV80_RETFI|nr:calmodulin-dependent protein kinase II-delta dash [Reticulomyxa filosa]|eukprot:ETO29714.1 calmodulin-dependent protein kinase II-delta dash [Reticulomyxa filosa]
MCLVLDLLEGGELFDRIIQHGHFTEKNSAQCFTQLISALAYLHEKQIVHRDLKVLVILVVFFFCKHCYNYCIMHPENLLFAKKCSDQQKFVAVEWNMKLIDFGLAGCCKDKGLTTPCGTPNYVAPEILRRQPYGTSVDMWSAGVILYIMFSFFLLCGFPPFYDENDDMNKLYKKIKNADFDMPSPYWDSVTPEAKDLVKKLLEPNPKKRITASLALEHEWLQGKASDKKLSEEQMFQLKRFQYVKRLRV